MLNVKATKNVGLAHAGMFVGSLVKTHVANAFDRVVSAVYEHVIGFN